jgi:hypothetical protein
MAKKLNPDVQAWSVAGDRILATIKPEMPQVMIDDIRERARRQAISDTFGAAWESNLDAHGRPQADGIGSDIWFCNVKDSEIERHLSAIARFIGPAAEKAERERIARLKTARGIK